MSTFKDRFKELRMEQGLSQKELGTLLGYSESTISLYESGLREPKKAQDLVKIADYFDVTLDYLLGRIDEKQCYWVSSDKFNFKINQKNHDNSKNEDAQLQLEKIRTILNITKK